jgi:hypothetical protein
MTVSDLTRDGRGRRRWRSGSSVVVPLNTPGITVATKYHRADAVSNAAFALARARVLMDGHVTCRLFSFPLAAVIPIA